MAAADAVSQSGEEPSVEWGAVSGSSSRPPGPSPWRFMSGRVRCLPRRRARRRQAGPWRAAARAGRARSSWCKGFRKREIATRLVDGLAALRRASTEAARMGPFMTLEHQERERSIMPIPRRLAIQPAAQHHDPALRSQLPSHTERSSLDDGCIDLVDFATGANIRPVRASLQGYACWLRPVCRRRN